MSKLSEFITSEIEINSLITDVRASLMADYYPLLIEYSYIVDTYAQEIDIKDNSGFQAFVVERATEKTYEVLDRLSLDLKPTADELTIWRAMVVPPDWLETGIHQRPIGICWAHEKDAAEAHFGDFSDGKKLIVIEGRANIEDIDWHTTILMNATMEEECEIRLKGTAKVTLTAAEWLSEDHKTPIGLEYEVHAGEATEPHATGLKM